MQVSTVKKNLRHHVRMLSMLLMAGGAMAMMSGCVAHSIEHRGSHHTTTYTQYGYPPLPLEEVRPNRPSNDHLWVPGQWTWKNDRYNWNKGRWDHQRSHVGSRPEVRPIHMPNFDPPKVHHGNPIVRQPFSQPPHHHVKPHRPQVKPAQPHVIPRHPHGNAPKHHQENKKQPKPSVKPGCPQVQITSYPPPPRRPGC